MAGVQFPVKMVHPNYVPAVLCGPKDDPRSGAPARFLPVIVTDEGQMGSYEAKGYVLEANYTPPPILSTAPGGDEYPKYVRNIICNNRWEEERVLNSPAEEGDDRKLTAIEVPPLPEGLEDQLKDALMARAKATGLELNYNGSAKEIQAELHRRLMGNG